jgi:hypothetical protein
MRTEFHKACWYPGRSSEAVETTKVHVGGVTGHPRQAATRLPGDIKLWVERVCWASPAVPGGKP